MTAKPRLARDLGLVGLAATGICSMIGASINVVPIMIQRNVPGIGPWVLPAFAFAAVPALLAALSYVMLASAMPPRTVVAVTGVMKLLPFLPVHDGKDLTAPVSAWYVRSTPVWLLVMIVGSLIYRRAVASLRRAGVSLGDRFSTLPPE